MPKAEKIQIRPLRETDEFNDPIGDEAEWEDVTAIAVVPRNSQDFEQRGPIVISGFMVVVKSKVVINSRYEVKVRGQVQQIEGDVGDYGRKKIFYTERAS